MVEIKQLGNAALQAILDGSNMTVTIFNGKKVAKGWPRGELLSVSDVGRNYSVDPVKVLKFIQGVVKENQKVA